MVSRIGSGTADRWSTSATQLSSAVSIAILNCRAPSMYDIQLFIISYRKPFENNETMMTTVRIIKTTKTIVDINCNSTTDIETR